ncbi:MAG: hypothetical protein HZA54_07955 [Planctomycetes bacterium]|nr:hypothetical protein [Planctomycetota bacterium]
MPDPSAAAPGAAAALPRGVGAGAALLAGLAVFCRFWNLSGQGLRTPDEGLHAFFAETIWFGIPGAVYWKPLEALLLAGAFRAWEICGGGSDVEPVVFLVPAALFGVASVLGLGWLAYRAWGWCAGLTGLAAAAAMPYLLFYHRSALADGNHLACGVAALLLLVGALPGGFPARPERRPGLAAAGSGALLGTAFLINPASGVITLGMGIGLIALAWLRPDLRRDVLRRLAIWAPAGIAAAGLWFGFLCLAPWYNRDFHAMMSSYNLAVAAASQARIEPFLYLWRYSGPVLLGLALVGAAESARRRDPCGVLLLALLGVGLVYGARAHLPYPRIFLAPVLPLAALAARGGGVVAAAAARRLRAGSRGELAVTLLLGVALIASHAPGARALLSLRSGFARAVAALAAERAEGAEGAGLLVLSAQSSNLMMPFGIETDSATVPLARALEGPNGAAAALDLLRDAARTGGYSHLMLDFTFRIELSPAGFGEFRHLLERFPPWQAIDNPAGLHEETQLENGIAAAADDPLSGKIFLWRLRGL